ncbi:CU044_5270 family protein [Nonomuraea sp. NPDC046802]|uniref:CU044_5270 family protein n=1 Tax=Nonomuraea sp. NPDC046802 TaxID=3154919 RepID=UPI0033C4ED4D
MVSERFRRISQEERMTDRTFAQLKPEGLDELTEEAHRRRRAADLAMAFQTPRKSPKVRFPLFITGGVVVAGLAAAAVVILPGGPARPGTGTPPSAARPAVTMLDAQAVLLAAAESAGRTEAGTGRYWYTRERVASLIQVDQDEYAARLKALAADAKQEEAVGKLKPSPLPYAAFSGSTDESWRARERGDASRNVRKPDAALTFGSAQDEQKWRQAGSPRLVQGGESTRDDRTERVLSIDNPSLTMRNVDKLPTDEAGLKRRLRELYGDRAASGFSVYLWQTGVDLLGAPITPGTRSALFRVMAEEKGMTAKSQVKDELGRTGAALITAGSGDRGKAVEYRIIVDPESGDLLQYEVAEEGASAPLLRIALEETGWVNELGKRP